MSENIKHKIQSIQQQLSHHANAITVLAASKAQNAQTVREAYACGIRHFGENYLQEALDKQAQLADLDIHWHFIGALQSNKCAAIAKAFDWVHSIDRVKIIDALAKHRASQTSTPLQCCIQVNLQAEHSKAGVASIEDIHTLCEAFLTYPQLRLRGLMAIPAANQDKRPIFKRLASIKNDLNARYSRLQLDTLSMGMSNDFQQAIAEGATIIRLGTALFGARH